MSKRFFIRIVALLLLLSASAQVYAQREGDSCWVARDGAGRICSLEYISQGLVHHILSYGADGRLRRVESHENGKLTLLEMEWGEGLLLSTRLTEADGYEREWRLEYDGEPNPDAILSYGQRMALDYAAPWVASGEFGDGVPVQLPARIYYREGWGGEVSDDSLVSVAYERREDGTLLRETLTAPGLSPMQIDY